MDQNNTAGQVVGGNWWEGGYTRRQKDGRLSFIIEREVGGVRYHVSTRCTARRAALKQLDRFESNPAEYKPTGEGPAAEIRLTADLISEFRAWQVEVRGNTSRHAYYVAKYLVDWMADLNGSDLRNVSLRDHVKPALAKRPARAHRIAALKALYAWLRKEKNVITSAHDCTLDLPVPQSRPENRRRKKVVDRLVVESAMARLSGPYLDCVLFLAATGWHLSELERFVRDDRSDLIELTPTQVEQHKCLAVARVLHKGRRFIATPIRTQQHLDAARRLRARRQMPRKLNDAIKAACDAAEVAHFTPGLMRHSFSTWHVQDGATVERVSVALDHQDPRTTRNFYVDLGVPRSDLPALSFTVAGGGPKN